jgi:hypothetical protein
MKGKGLKDISTGLARSNRAKASSRTGVSPPGASVLACRFASAISHGQYFGRRSDMSGTYTATWGELACGRVAVVRGDGGGRSTVVPIEVAAAALLALAEAMRLGGASEDDRQEKDEQA